jgi:sporulation protein YlmC with PRC-barrel domain
MPGLARPRIAEGGPMAQTHWHPSRHEDYQELIGREVYTHDGERVGRVEQILEPPAEMEQQGHHHLIVRPEEMGGPLGADVAYIPESQVAMVSTDAVELTVDKRQVKDQDWARLPASLDPHDTPAPPLPEDVPPVPEGGWYEESHRSSQ